MGLTGSIYGRALAKVRREGLRGGYETFRERVRLRFDVEETHLWFEMSLKDRRFERVPLSRGARFVAGTISDTDYLQQIPSVSVAEGIERLETGNHLWLADSDGKPGFSCWTLYGSVPVLAAPGGRMPLPEGVAMLEDSVALPGLRNQGLSRSTLQNVLSMLQQMGLEALITRTRHDNIPPQRLAVKLGMHEICSNYYRRKGLATYGYVSATDTPTARWIADRLRP